ncbi:MAG: glycerol-3-phosphate 1-O-acyltransferase PlsY [Armatimonadetes bacterium]|nr:glycerol-3-phosphate 1-O-acyltransferase PlsY [Armatimonadota bacterium]NIM23117.1 glycerol-3-phosphate 1-O-acyltransferase PlsY [Armatimonadota bacterium]NIM66985.1 glycerol-3-phosphate 1-O-acyltransferase PlsY [Armatimonadota bacterium]NIM75519.1 glycerol-3-phosphate 1-O-acyltransferase PlsY [Armatimonadota bacterium]NIN05174.1 glycerol-3-phosphate 1-O-acyltransferase PlsY [Armatimonadota bacterium]
MILALFMLAAYLVGGIPFGLIIAKTIRGVDIRQLGSRNIGATNVLRTVGWKGGLVVLILDAAKGFLPVLLAKSLFPNPIVTVGAGLAAMLGHTFSPFLRFTGGRGVATGLGVMLALSWEAALCGLGVALALMAAFRYVSLGSIMGSLSLPFFMLMFRQPLAYIIFTSLAAILIVVRHLPNIRRLLAGEEHKFGERPSQQAVAEEE